MNKKKLLSTIFIWIFMITVFSVMVFSFGMTSFQKGNASIYNSDLVTSNNNYLVEESGWTLEQMSTSSVQESTNDGNSSVILTDPEGVDHAYIWGSNSSGQLGLGETDTEWSAIPLEVDFDMVYSDIKFLSVYDSRAMAVLTDENGNDFLYAWGKNAYGELGLPNYGPSDTYNKPTQVNLTKTTGKYDEIKSIDIGDSAAYIVLTTDNIDSVWSAGANFYGQLGTNYGGANRAYKQVIFPEDIVTITSSDFGRASKVVAINEEGESILYTWGYGKYYQQGPVPKQEDTPIEYIGLPPGEIKQVTNGVFAYNTMVVLVDEYGNEQLYSWGINTNGELGVGSAAGTVKSPTLVKFPDKYVEIKDIGFTSSKEFSNAFAVTVDVNGKEHFYLWGSNANSAFGGSNSESDKRTPFEIKPKSLIDDDYVIKEVSLSETYRAVILDYKGSNQLYMWGSALQGAMGGTKEDGTNNISNIDMWKQTPMITFDNGPPSVINDDDKGKMLSFTLDWDKLSVTPTKLEIIDSDGKSLIGDVSLSGLEPGEPIEMNIEGVIPEGVENVRFKISNDADTLVISQSFNIDESFLDTFDDNISANYNWFTTKKKLSFTLNYPSSISLASVQVIDVGTNESIDIKIDPGDVINGVEYKMDISDFENESKLYVYISAEFTNGDTIVSEDFYIPSTKFPGWIISFIALIIIIIIIIIIVIVLIILRAKASYNREHKMAKMKRAYR